jgi:hypothetical protein
MGASMQTRLADLSGRTVKAVGSFDAEGEFRPGTRAKAVMKSMPDDIAAEFNDAITKAMQQADAKGVRLTAPRLVADVLDDFREWETTLPTAPQAGGWRTSSTPTTSGSTGSHQYDPMLRKDRGWPRRPTARGTGPVPPCAAGHAVRSLLDMADEATRPRSGRGHETPSG